MSLTDDTRARVPFALVGVLLLVGSATYAVTLNTRAPVETDRRVAHAVEEATALARTGLTRAVERAGRKAAGAPLVTPANTTFGRALNDSTPFRDYLRIRVYVAARRALCRTVARDGNLRVTLSLPAVSDTASLRAAKRRVRLGSRVGDRPRLAVTFRNVTIIARRGDTVVTRREYTPTVTVATPVLALHRRVAAFEKRLNRSPLEDGLSARVTGELAAMAWARGAAQYTGAPITNVLGNRHLEVATNGALLELQRESFGVSDPRGRRLRTRAAEIVGLTDLFHGAVDAEWTGAMLDPVKEPATARLQRERRPKRPDADGVTIGVNHSADRAYLAVARSGEWSVLDRIVDDVYTADVRLATRTETLNRTVTTHGNVPEGWEFAGERSHTDDRMRPAEVEPIPVDAPTHRLASYARVVERERCVVRTWKRGDRTRTTSTVHRTRHLVRVAVVGRHAVTDRAPRRSIRRAHDSGGPLDGQQFAGVRERAVERLLASNGGVEGVIARALAGDADTGWRSLDVQPPEGIEQLLLRDLERLRERAANRSVTVRRRATLNGSAARKLLAAVRNRRSEMVDAPGTYPSVAAKTRVAVRAAYLDALLNTLRKRAREAQGVGNRLRSTLEDHGISMATLRRAFRSPSPVVEPTGGVVTAVSGEPPYLTTSVVRPRHTRAVDGPYYPLTARNWNVYTLPLGDAVDGIADTLVSLGGDEVSLGSGGRALRAANETLSASDNATLRRHRSNLRPKVSTALGEVRSRLRRTLTLHAGWLPASERTDVLRYAFGRWDTIHGRALAAANGSLVGAVVDAARRSRNPTPVRLDALGVRIRTTLRDVNKKVGVPEDAVRSVGNVSRAVLRTAVAEGLRTGGEAALERWTGIAATAVPSGLPLVPGWWAATLNVWDVTVRGRYARFAVRAPGSTPLAANVTYVRRSSPTALDVDDDGRVERLGSNRPVEFAVDTAIPVLVPPGLPGVGDDTTIETSPGWPRPGPD